MFGQFKIELKPVLVEPSVRKKCGSRVTSPARLAPAHILRYHARKMVPVQITRIQCGRVFV